MGVKRFKSQDAARKAAAKHRSTKGCYADVRHHKGGGFVMYFGRFKRRGK